MKPTNNKIKMKTKKTKQVAAELNMLADLSKISDAYAKAIDGKIKFGEVKQMFKKLHKEIKKSSKK